MPRFGIILSIVVLVVALFLLFSRLFAPEPITIQLTSGQQITSSTPEIFSLSQVLLLTICAFAVGMAALYLYYNSDQAKPVQKSQSLPNIYEVIMPMLKPDERSVITALRESNGELPQNKLVVKLNLNKVKATRILYSLQHKGLITKERHGLTNMVKLKKH